MASALFDFQIHELRVGRDCSKTPPANQHQRFWEPANPRPPQTARSTDLDLTCNHEVVDVVEGLLDALSDGHQPVVPENEDLRGTRELHGAKDTDAFSLSSSLHNLKARLHAY